MEIKYRLDELRNLLDKSRQQADGSSLYQQVKSILDSLRSINTEHFYNNAYTSEKLRDFDNHFKAVAGLAEAEERWMVQAESWEEAQVDSAER